MLAGPSSTIYTMRKALAHTIHALEAASKIPAVRTGTIEIRPIMKFG